MGRRGRRLSTAVFAFLFADLLQQGRPEEVVQERPSVLAVASGSRSSLALDVRRKHAWRHSARHAGGRGTQPNLGVADYRGEQFERDGDGQDGTANDSEATQDKANEAVPTSIDMGERLMGFFCVFVACIGFGSNFIPVKLVDTRDGQYFMVWMAVGIFLVGLVQWKVCNFYKFEPFAMLGGAIWAVGNLFVPFIVKNTGLGVGQLVWGATNMLTGWATGTFGLFGKNVDFVADPRLNYLGVLISVLSLGIFTQMVPESGKKTDGDIEFASSRSEKVSNNFIAGFVVAILCGVLFGSNFDPPTYLQQLGAAAVMDGRTPEHSPDAMDYVVSHFAGILLLTVVAFTIYNSVFPGCYVSNSMILPGLASGIGWGVAQMAWFKANSALSYVIAFPIIVAVPGIIASIWGVVLFGENCGFRNLSLLATVLFIQAISVTMIAVSKDGLRY